MAAALTRLNFAFLLQANTKARHISLQQPPFASMKPVSLARLASSTVPELGSRPPQQRGIKNAPLINLSSFRFAGHAKWQNISRTKSANDAFKSKLCNRYVRDVKKAIMRNNMVADPKLNRQLADVLLEASKMNVPRATLDRAIERSKNFKLIETHLEIEGPGKTSVIVRVETDNISETRREVKKIIKKIDSYLTHEGSKIKMFRSQGIVRAATKTTDGKYIDLDFAEEAAIRANAEEVMLEEYDDVADKDLAKAIVFITTAEGVGSCKSELEKLNFKIISSDSELVAYNPINFGQEVNEQLQELVKQLRGLSEVIDIYHNAVM